MEPLKFVISKLLKSENKNSREKFIYYKIIDFISIKNKFLVQCINSRVTFQANIADIVSDADILHGFHPIQASYIGIEYSKYMKNNLLQNGVTRNFKYLDSRYGEYDILYQDRKGNICFSQRATNKEFLEDPRNIVLASDLIGEFDASQAFYIGLMAGFKLYNSIRSPRNKYCPVKHSYLKLVKKC